MLSFSFICVSYLAIVQTQVGGRRFFLRLTSLTGSSLWEAFSFDKGFYLCYSILAYLPIWSCISLNLYIYLLYFRKYEEKLFNDICSICNGIWLLYTTENVPNVGKLKVMCQKSAATWGCEFLMESNWIFGNKFKKCLPRLTVYASVTKLDTGSANSIAEKTSWSKWLQWQKLAWTSSKTLHKLFQAQNLKTWRKRW